ncbi:hypothetical protein WUBG_02274, partial [Wuchereria bancrofti]
MEYIFTYGGRVIGSRFLSTWRMATMDLSYTWGNMLRAREIHQNLVIPANYPKSILARKNQRDSLCSGTN